jgi:hypothetical protein
LRRGARVGAGRVGRPRSMLMRPFGGKYGRTNSYWLAEDPA